MEELFVEGRALEIELERPKAVYTSRFCGMFANSGSGGPSSSGAALLGTRSLQLCARPRARCPLLTPSGLGSGLDEAWLTWDSRAAKAGTSGWG